MRRQRSGDVQHRHFDGGVLPGDAKVVAAHVRVDEHRQVGRVHVAREVHAVTLRQVVVPLLRALHQMTIVLYNRTQAPILNAVMNERRFRTTSALDYSVVPFLLHRDSNMWLSSIF